jgi:hypothetical protein
LLEWLLSGVNWSYMALAFSAMLVEALWGLHLTHSPVPSVRERGYSLIWESLEGFTFGALLLLSIAVFEGPILGWVKGVDVATAERMWAEAQQRLSDYLLSIALLERDLSLTVVFSSLAGTVGASSILARFMAQYLLFFSTAMLFLTYIVKGYGSLMFSIGIALASVRRVRSIGSYLVFSVIAIVVASCSLAPFVYNSLQSLRFSYKPGIIDVFSEAFKQLFTDRLRDLIEDGKLLSYIATVATVAVAVITAVAAALSRASGGLMDTLMSRVRGL